jgi:DNA polymerase III subunit delta
MPLTTISKILQRLSKRQIDPLYLCFGEESYLIQEYTATLIEGVLQGGSRDFNCDVFSADSSVLSEVLDIARTLPLMASYRVVVLHGVHQLRKDTLPQLEAYAEQPSESTAFICSSPESDPKTFSIRLWQKALAVACKQLEGSQLYEWISTQVRQYDCTISGEAMQAFTRDQQHDLWTLRQEIDKLCTYVGPSRAITRADVQEVCYASRQQSLFALSDAIGTHQILQAFTVLEKLLAQGEPPLVIFSMLVRHLRLLWSVRQLAQRSHDDTHTAKTLGLPFAVYRRLVNQSRYFPPERLRQLYTAAIAADVTFKTTNKPPQATLEGLILELCARH